MNEKYEYHGIDITYDLYEIMTSVVERIAEKENKSFDECYAAFLNSSLYDALRNTETVMWSESIEYLVDEYYRRAAVNNGERGKSID